MYFMGVRFNKGPKNILCPSGSTVNLKASTLKNAEYMRLQLKIPNNARFCDGYCLVYEILSCTY